MKLDSILKKYEVPQMRVAVRNIRNRSIVESKRPQSGAYWWLPTPDGDWELDVYFNSEFRGDTMHDRMWRKYVIDRLAVLWNKDPQRLRRSIGDNYAGLPRGRVYGKSDDLYIIAHGDDAPVKSGISKIVRAFSLTSLQRAGKVVAEYDDHENMLIGDPEVVQRALGVSLGLRGNYQAFDDDDEYNDYND